MAHRYQGRAAREGRPRTRRAPDGSPGARAGFAQAPDDARQLRGSCNRCVERARTRHRDGVPAAACGGQAIGGRRRLAAQGAGDRLCRPGRCHPGRGEPSGRQGVAATHHVARDADLGPPRTARLPRPRGPLPDLVESDAGRLCAGTRPGNGDCRTGPALGGTGICRHPAFRPRRPWPAATVEPGGSPRLHCRTRPASTHRGCHHSGGGRQHKRPVSAHRRQGAAGAATGQC